MKADYETYVVRVGRRRGERYAERRALQIPWAAATGHYERLSELALRELLNDLTEERDRRSSPARARTYNPLLSQVRKPQP